jgi:hypothetical protein
MRKSILFCDDEESMAKKPFTESRRRWEYGIGICRKNTSEQAEESRFR